ncbi:ABC transporter permease [Gammaproteobacteria bacterium]|jgi:ABC-2 type transport system permease protein|nr:ABC transporter permease [Gammaproteobacteria bacterium]MDB3909309.1 ABC transporter permease [Gammaproteobacteria bacterium]MDC3267463.1 ABC transporter permease [bacterium]
MPSKLQLHLAKVFLKIFLRDRQSIFFSLFFPIIFMTVFAFANNGEVDPIELGIVNNSPSAVANDFSQMLIDNPLFEVTLGEEEQLRAELVEGNQTMVLILPEGFDAQSDGAELQLLVDAAQVQQLSLIMPLLEQTLISIEREFRNIEPMFTLTVEDVQARSQRYLDFLLPGLLAFTLMQLSIAGSGFNIVEYRRKGILKRLFVTPIRPRDFIASIVMARMAIVLIQLTVLILVAVLVLNVTIVGNFVSFYFIVMLGTFIFLCLGFCLGSIAKTQQAVMAVGNIVIFPQIFLSGVFYPIESMPELIQPIAKILPLSFVSTAMREIANNGASLLSIAPSLFGIALWFVIAFILATRLFVWKEVAN